MQSIIKPYRGKFPTVLLFGPPGAGKGTLGRFLDQANTQRYVSSGDIFRSLDPESSAGQLYYAYAKDKKLVPDDVTLEIWWHYVQGLIATNRYYPASQDLLLEGIPRTAIQAKALLQWIEVRHIIVLESFDQHDLYHRMLRRARLEGKLQYMTEPEFEQQFKEYLAQIDDVLKVYPSHLISRVNAEQRSLEVLRDVLVRLSHILSSRPNSKQ
ncbi:MAG: nucleoside monophosphate kinase [Verrucomicrobia bacterium]|nr:nucleoside monophosphate kinase [Verrucomicrobiota bacterium]MBS0646889.1 nucleoside monophosphate kinase [Verrucomicrobiota bacterium]